jgi:hypothetical protein
LAFPDAINCYCLWLLAIPRCNKLLLEPAHKVQSAEKARRSDAKNYKLETRSQCRAPALAFIGATTWRTGLSTLGRY